MRLRARRIQAADVRHNLPALQLRESAPAGHAFIGIPILEDPRDLSVGRTLQPFAAQARPRALPRGVLAVTFRAVVQEKVAPSRCCLPISGKRVRPLAIALTYPLQPRPIAFRISQERKRKDDT